MLVPFIGTGPVHGPMVLDAADSTVRLMLSLNVNANQPLARRCQIEPVLRAGDELWCWNDAGGSYQIALEEPRIIKIVQARHSSRSALSSTTAATWWWLGRGARWPCRAEIEDSDKAILLYLVARVTYIISQ